MPKKGGALTIQKQCKNKQKTRQNYSRKTIHEKQCKTTQKATKTLIDCAQKLKLTIENLV